MAGRVLGVDIVAMFGKFEGPILFPGEGRRAIALD